MSDFVKGEMLGAVLLLITMNNLTKFVLWLSAMIARNNNETREQYIDERVLSYRKRLERTLPYWEEVS